MFHYNYIFFNPTDGSSLVKNNDGYYTICIKDLEGIPGVQVVSQPVYHMPYIMRILYLIHNSKRINHIIDLPFKKVWYPYYFKLNEYSGKPLCFIINNFQLSPDYLRYLKSTYPDAKFVKIHRDLISLFIDRYPDYTEQFCNDTFDLNLTFDKEEADKLGWIHFDEFESKIDIKPNPNLPICDVLFIGKAKDRLSRLMSIYNYFTSQGISVKYYLTGVPTDERKPLQGVTFADKNMSYRQMLIETLSCKCVLELNQAGASGYTSRFLEAVMYNKKLITDNAAVKDSEFYNPEYVQVIDNISKIDVSFLRKNDEVNFNYKDEFSPIQLIDKVDKVLSE